MFGFILLALLGFRFIVIGRGLKTDTGMGIAAAVVVVVVVVVVVYLYSASRSASNAAVMGTYVCQTTCCCTGKAKKKHGQICLHLPN